MRRQEMPRLAKVLVAWFILTLTAGCGSDPNAADPKFVVLQTAWIGGCYLAVDAPNLQDLGDPTDRGNQNRCLARVQIKNEGGRGQGDLVNRSFATLTVASRDIPPAGFCVTDVPWIEPGATAWVSCELSDWAFMGPIPTADGPPKAQIDG